MYRKDWKGLLLIYINILVRERINFKEYSNTCRWDISTALADIQFISFDCFLVFWLKIYFYRFYIYLPKDPEPPYKIMWRILISDLKQRFWNSIVCRFVEREQKLEMRRKNSTIVEDTQTQTSSYSKIFR